MVWLLSYFSHHKQNKIAVKTWRTWRTEKRTKNWKSLIGKFLYARQKWHMLQWRLISKTAWKVIHSSQNWFQKLISTHFSATHMSPLPVQTSIYTTRWAIIKARKGCFNSETMFYLHSPIPSYNEFAPSRVLVSPLEKVSFNICYIEVSQMQMCDSIQTLFSGIQTVQFFQFHRCSWCRY